MPIDKEHLECLEEKAAFIHRLEKTVVGASGSAVVALALEAYECPDDGYFEEFIVITFKGGAISPITVTWNSNSANLRTVGRIIDGGYYEEVERYKRIRDSWRRIDISGNLKKGMSYITLYADEMRRDMWKDYSSAAGAWGADEITIYFHDSDVDSADHDSEEDSEEVEA